MAEVRTYVGYFDPDTHSGAPPPCDCNAPVLVWAGPMPGEGVLECAACRCVYTARDVNPGAWPAR